MCEHHFDDEPAGLVCTRTDEHDPTARGGHCYRSSSGSEVGDRHDATSGGEH